MESIEQMIKRLCPEGVTWKKISEVFELRNGYTPSKANADFWTDGTIPWFRMEDIRANGRILNDSIQHITPSAIKGKGLFPANSFILATTATIGEHALIIADSLANQQFTNLSVRKSLKNMVDIKYLFHYMFIIDDWCKKNVNSSSFASVDMDKLKEYKIPLPPLSIQSRIVEILDKMTELELKLEAELEAELEARKQQYEYYRNKLLTFDNVGGVKQVKCIKLGEAGNFYGGLSGKSKKDFVDGNAKFITYMNVYSNPSLRVDVEDKVVIREGERQNTIQYGDILFTGSSETPDECGMSSVLTTHVEENLYLNSFCFGFRFNDLTDINPHFLKHLFRSAPLRKAIAKTANGVTRFNVSKKLFAEIAIPIPPMAEQSRIVSILDRFEALTTDLQIGLPAEIEARRQQYEYYRNKLLTFDAA